VGVAVKKEVLISAPSTRPVFKGIQKLSLLDYPEKMATIVFVGGCNFRCPFCYNAELVLNSPELPSVPESGILEYLKNRREWLDGVVITGGEPTMYPELPDFLQKVKRIGLEIKLDTNGSNPGMLGELMREGLVDYVALDVKAPLREEKYGEVAGVPNMARLVERSAKLLLSSQIEYELRTTVVPTLLEENDVLEIAERIKGAKRYYLQQFKRATTHLDERFSKIEPYPLEFLRDLQKKVSSYFKICKVRGG